LRQTSFLQSQTILRALEFALAKGAFTGHPKQKKTATSLVKELSTNRSVSGRHFHLLGMLKKGASLEQMAKASGASRRTIFRYLNHFEDAGFSIRVSRGVYQLKSS
jgi:hypothetical protein